MTSTINKDQFASLKNITNAGTLPFRYICRYKKLIRNIKPMTSTIKLDKDQFASLKNITNGHSRSGTFVDIRNQLET